MGTEMLEMVSAKYKDLDKVPVLPKVEPGFLRKKLPASPPMKAESFEAIMNDTSNIVYNNNLSHNFYIDFHRNNLMGSS